MSILDPKKWIRFMMPGSGAIVESKIMDLMSIRTGLDY